MTNISSQIFVYSFARRENDFDSVSTICQYFLKTPKERRPKQTRIIICEPG